AKVRDVAIVVIEPRHFEVSVAGHISRLAHNRETESRPQGSRFLQKEEICIFAASDFYDQYSTIRDGQLDAILTIA
ncbi:MAG: hypothetical protein MUQ30_08820, partial [Anaerolineae bacterium]|nr:hypothetical protein [Anaerolineae bacterium]